MLRPHPRHLEGEEHKASAQKVQGRVLDGSLRVGWLCGVMQGVFLEGTVTSAVSLGAQLVVL